MAARVSRGCLPCRTRRVKCDGGRPSCQRCLKRDEVCNGYRDESTLLFRDENEKAARRSTNYQLQRRASFGSSPRSTPSSTSPSKSPSSRQIKNLDGPSDISAADIAGLNLRRPFPWVKHIPPSSMPSAEDQAVSQFFEKFVMYPCNNSSSSGFLEHLPSLFKEVHVEGRVALRWAVRAAAYAGLSNESENVNIGNKALQCYGLALTALGEALVDPKRAPDDYTLMTVVVLDLFESIYLQDRTSLGSHTVGMAHILRLRGPNQIYSTRGWGLFRLSHHRLQKQQLAFGIAPLPESDGWLNSLNDELPEVQIEKTNHDISKTCEKARNLLANLNIGEASVEQTLEMIKEMHTLDKDSTTWRIGPDWSYKTVARSEISDDLDVVSKFPEFVQLHRDVWIAYEWNYHRTARIILHEQILACLNRLETISGSNDETSGNIAYFRETSISIIQFLTDEVLSTVPQSLGDIDQEGKLLSSVPGTTFCKGIGGYFLLWPIRVIKATPFATPKQTLSAKNIFERIRDCTGMKTALGGVSSV